MSNCSNNVNGSNTSIKVKEEDFFGISEINGFKKIYIKEDTIKASQNQIDSELITGGRQESKAGTGNIEAGGGLTVAVDNEQFGFWLKMLMGTVNSTDLGTGKHKHQFLINDNCIPSFQREKGFESGVLNYLGVGLKVDKMGIELGNEGEVLAGLDIIGKNEFLKLETVDTNETTLAVDANLNSKTITVSDASAFVKGEGLVLQESQYTLIATVFEKSSTSIELVDATGINEGDFLKIGEAQYKALNISGNIILLNRQLEVNTIASDFIDKETPLGTITNIVGNDISFTNALKGNITVGDTYLRSGSTSTLFNAETFQNFKLKVASTNGDPIISKIKTMKFDYENNSEAQRLLKNAGEVGEIIEGMAKIKLELTLLLSVEAAFFIEDAKNGTEFDISIKSTNTLGDSLEFVFPNGTITPTTPEVTGPAAIEITVEYKPFKKGSENSIEAYLINEVSSY